MRMRKFLAVLLVASMVLTALLMTGCSGGGGRGPVGDVYDEDLSPSVDGEYKSYNGKFNVATLDDGTATSAFNIVDLVADDNLGDASIVKSVRERNQIIEDNFGVKIVRIKLGNIDATTTAIQTAVASNDTTYDAFMNILNRMSPIALQGGMLDLSRTPYVDVEASWWDKAFSRDLVFAGGVYFIAGDCNTVDKDATFITLFNEYLLDVSNKGWDASKLYDTVLEGVGAEGGWTMELLIELARTHSADDVNDQNMWNTTTYTGDGYYGLFTQSRVGQIMVVGAGYSATVPAPNAAGVKANLTIEFEKAVNDATQYFGDVSGERWFCNLDKHQNSVPGFWDICARGSFKANRATFFICHAGTIDRIRDMKENYGVLPIAKLYDTQAEYGTSIQYDNCRVYSAMNRSDYENEKTSYILEHLAYYSSYDYAGEQSLNYTYYTRVMKAKGVRDDKAWAMLDLIFDNRKYQIAALLADVWGGVEKAVIGDSMFSREAYTNLDAKINDNLKILLGRG